MKDNKQIIALISLLDDPDEFIYNEVKNKLMSLGDETIPFLEEYWETNAMNATSQSRIEELIQEIQFDTTFSNIEKWLESDSQNLMRGALLINQIQYPDLDPKLVLDTIEKIKIFIFLLINDLKRVETYY